MPFTSVPADNPFSYAGVPLKVPLRETAEWIEKNLSLGDVLDFERPTWTGKNRVGWTFPGTIRERPIKLNTLWWPTGAARFAVGHFLTTDSGLATIRTATATSPAQPFTLGQLDQTGTLIRSFFTNLFALPARPLSAPCPGSAQLWLLTLVDQRYFWWLQSSGAIVITPTSTWSDVLAAVGSALGISIGTDTIASAYLGPSPSFSARYESLPLMLDAVAYNLGKRVVCGLDGSVSLMGYSSSLDILNSNLLAYPALQAGGSIDMTRDGTAAIPSSVVVTFPKAGICSPELWTETVALADLHLSEFSGLSDPVEGAKVFHDTAKANLGPVTAEFQSKTLDVHTLSAAVTTSTTHPQLVTLDGQLVTLQTDLSTLATEFDSDPDITATMTSVNDVYNEIHTLNLAGGSPSSGDITTLTGILDNLMSTRAVILGYPVNIMELDALAVQIATDWYRWQLASLDIKFAGICPVAPEGLSDWIEWSYLKWDVSTRMQRAPWNDLTEELLHESSCHLSMDEWFPAKIMDGTNPYGWIEQAFLGDGTTADATYPRQGTTDLFRGFELNNADDVAADTIVWMKCGKYHDDTGEQEYEFSIATSGAGPSTEPGWVEIGLDGSGGGANIQNNYALGSTRKLDILTSYSGAGVVFNGIDYGTAPDGTRLYIRNNIHSVNIISFGHLSSAGTVNHRIKNPNGYTYSISPGMTVELSLQKGYSDGNPDGEDANTFWVIVSTTAPVAQNVALGVVPPDFAGSTFGNNVFGIYLDMTSGLYINKVTHAWDGGVLDDGETGMTAIYLSIKDASKLRNGVVNIGVQDFLGYKEWYGGVTNSTIVSFIDNTGAPPDQKCLTISYNSSMGVGAGISLTAYDGSSHACLVEMSVTSSDAQFCLSGFHGASLPNHSRYAIKDAAGHSIYGVDTGDLGASVGGAAQVWLHHPGIFSYGGLLTVNVDVWDPFAAGVGPDVLAGGGSSATITVNVNRSSSIDFTLSTGAKHLQVPSTPAYLAPQQGDIVVIKCTGAAPGNATHLDLSAFNSTQFLTGSAIGPGFGSYGVYLYADSTWYPLEELNTNAVAGTGTVTSVNVLTTSAPGLSASGGPITTTGSISLAWASESAHTFLAGPTSGGAAAMTVRTIVAADLGTGTANSGTVLHGDLTWSAVGAGTVTSVALALPSSVFSVSGSPVTSTGTLTGSLQVQSANQFWAGPTSGGAAAPTFRAPISADIASCQINVGTQVSGGTLDEIYGGTGNSVYVTGDILYAHTSTLLGRLPGPTSTDVYVLTSQGTGSVANIPAWSNNLDTSILTSGVLPTDRGGTGTIPDERGSFLVSDVSNNWYEFELPTTGGSNQILMGDNGGTPDPYWFNGGANGTFANPTSITVVNGIITAIS